ncbi:MAG: hypothetical protein ACWGQW_03320 [bacterium]
MSFVTSVCEDVKRKLAVISKQRVALLADSVLGVSIDTWGSVKELSPKLVQDVLKCPGVQEARQRMVEEIAKAFITGGAFRKSDMLGVVSRLRSHILQQAEQELKQELVDTLMVSVKKALLEEMKKDKELRELLVVDQLIKANRK